MKNQQQEMPANGCDRNLVKAAKDILSAPDQSEEAYLGAKAILMLQGLE